MTENSPYHVKRRTQESKMILLKLKSVPILYHGEFGEKKNHTTTPVFI